MCQLNAAVGSTIGKLGADLFAFHFYVLVIGMCHPYSHALKTTEWVAVISAQVPAALLHIDVGIAVLLLFFIVLMTIVIMLFFNTVPVGWTVGVAIGVLVRKELLNRTKHGRAGRRSPSAQQSRRLNQLHSRRL